MSCLTAQCRRDSPCQQQDGQPRMLATLSRRSLSRNAPGTLARGRVAETKIMPSTKFLLAGCQAASSGPDQQHSQSPVASVSSVQPAENLPADALLTDGLLQPCLAILLGRIAVAAERAAAANERIAAAVEQVATIGPYLTSSSSVVPAVPANTPTNRQKQRRNVAARPTPIPKRIVASPRSGRTAATRNTRSLPGKTATRFAK